jgi:hypothetical protein
MDAGRVIAILLGSSRLVSALMARASAGFDEDRSTALARVHLSLQRARGFLDDGVSLDCSWRIYSSRRALAEGFRLVSSLSESQICAFRLAAKRTVTAGGLGST